MFKVRATGRVRYRVGQNSCRTTYDVAASGSARTAYVDRTCVCTPNAPARRRSRAPVSCARRGGPRLQHLARRRYMGLMLTCSEVPPGAHSSHKCDEAPRAGARGASLDRPSLRLAPLQTAERDAVLARTLIPPDAVAAGVVARRRVRLRDRN